MAARAYDIPRQEDRPMFETVELGQKLVKKEYEARLPELRSTLLKMQRDLRSSDTRVLLICTGVDGAGKGAVVNHLSEWLDTRGLDTYTYWRESDEERERPLNWRYWRSFPSRGRIGIHFSAWYQDLILAFAHGKMSGEALDAELQRVAFLERMLSVDGALVLKFWLHLSKKAQKKRLTSLEKATQTRRLVTKSDWKNHKHYDQFIAAAERVIRQTSTGITPWILVDASNSRHRDITVAETLATSTNRHLQSRQTSEKAVPPKTPPIAAHTNDSKTILDSVDLTHKLERDEYNKKLKRYQARLGHLAWTAFDAGRSNVVVFEGWDAGGKGGCIRRLTVAMDARLYRVISVAAPTDEERAHHYLWRFWRHIPRAGSFTAYDRSWYGRVLVERVEGFATPAEWQRAYLEINDFEEQLSRHGIIINKFFLHISQEEQLRRFHERENTPHKQHKITEEDWRNREKWPQYEDAVNEMVARTSTQYAPWHIIGANDKKYARIEILKICCRRIEKALAESNH
jgi:polyphosphate:AMP phosphotransferase